MRPSARRSRWETGSWWKGPVCSRFEFVSNETHSASRARYNLPGAKSRCATLSRCRRSSLRAAYPRVQEGLCWQARKTDSSGPPSPILTESPESQSGLTGSRANSKRIGRSCQRSASDVIQWLSKVKKNSSSTGLAGESKVKRCDSPPPQVRSAGRVSISKASSCRRSNS